MAPAMRFVVGQQGVPLQTSFAFMVGALVPTPVSPVIPVPKSASPVTAIVPSIGKPFKFVLASSKMIAGWFGVTCEDCPDDSIWGCYVTNACWKVVIVALGAIFLFIALLMAISFLGQIDDLLKYQRQLTEYEKAYPTLAKIMIIPLKKFHKTFTETYAKTMKSLTGKFGKKPWFKFLVLMPCKCLRSTWVVFQKVYQPACLCTGTACIKIKKCIAETGCFQWAADKALKKAGLKADPEGDRNRAIKAKKKARQAKIDEKKAKKQAKIDPKQAKKDEKAAAKQARLEERASRKRAKKEAKEARREAQREARAARNDAKLDALEDAEEAKRDAEGAAEEAKQDAIDAEQEAKQEAAEKAAEEAKRDAEGAAEEAKQDAIDAEQEAKLEAAEKAAEEEAPQAPPSSPAPSSPPSGPPPSPAPPTTMAPPGMPPAMPMTPPAMANQQAMYGFPAQQYVDPYAAQQYVDPYGAQQYVDPYATQQYVDPYGAQQYVDPYATQQYVDPYAAQQYVDPYGAQQYVDPNAAQQYAADLYGAQGAQGQGYGAYGQEQYEMYGNDPMYAQQQGAYGQDQYGAATPGQQAAGYGYAPSAANAQQHPQQQYGGQQYYAQ